MPLFQDGLEEVRCPTYIGNAPCDCVAASDGLDFTCSSERTRLADIRSVVSAARFAIKTLVVTRLDPNATYIRERTFANGKTIFCYLLQNFQIRVYWIIQRFKNYYSQAFSLLNMSLFSQSYISILCEMELCNFLWLMWSHYLPLPPI